jgi:hypothetical protein
VCLTHAEHSKYYPGVTSIPANLGHHSNHEDFLLVIFTSFLFLYLPFTGYRNGGQDYVSTEQSYRWGSCGDVRLSHDDGAIVTAASASAAG